ncbi:DMT family transporter [Shewanella marisflavi]|uniref:DMT family transporter n=1 Tax=Shewanella marisflavi TaxID=260364 RepID=UPI003AAE83C6
MVQHDGQQALGLSASIAFIMAGQILFGLVCDRLGLFGMARRRLSWCSAWLWP